MELKHKGTSRNKAVFGIYPNRLSQEQGAQALKESGFRSADISLLMPENHGTKDLAHEKATKAPEGATTGAGAGAVVGGIFGWLAGIGMLAIPGVGPLLAAGPIVALLAGVGVGGTVGGVAGGLVGLRMPEYEAKRFEGRIKEGGILFSVHCDDSEWANRAKEILGRTGAQDISATGEATADFDISDRPLPRTA